jgi:hypothetical protein
MLTARKVGTLSFMTAVTGIRNGGIWQRIGRHVSVWSGNCLWSSGIYVVVCDDTLLPEKPNPQLEAAHVVDGCFRGKIVTKINLR